MTAYIKQNDEEFIQMTPITLDKNGCIVCKNGIATEVLSCCNIKVCKKCFKKILEIDKTCSNCEKDYSQLLNPKLNMCENIFGKIGCCEFKCDIQDKKILLTCLLLWYFFNYCCWVLIYYFCISPKDGVLIFAYSLWSGLLSSSFILLILFVIYMICRTIRNRLKR